MRWAKYMVAGMIGGLAGSLAMSGLRLVLQRLDLLDTPLPLKLERRIERRAGVAHKTGPAEEQALAMGMHLGIGATFGAAYGIVRSALGLPALSSGLLYGLMVYAVNLAGAGPAADLTTPPWKQEPGVVARRVGNHLLYGIVTGLVSDRLQRLIR